MEVKKDILWRVYLCFLCIVVLGVMVLGRAVYIQQVQGSYWQKMGDSLHQKFLPINAERGSIYSEDGNMLSTSVPVFDIYVDFGAEGIREKNGKRFWDNLDSLSISLSSLFNDKTTKEYKNQLEQAYENKERYYVLKKKISFEKFRLLRNFPLVRQGRNKSGFIFDTRDKRINPYVLLANRTIGLSREDSTKNVGLERTYDSLLKGVSGQRLMQYTAGAYMPVQGAELDPVNGKDIITTLDTYIQDVAENALMKMVSGNNSLHGTAIVMETATGKIKAIANLGKQPDGTFIEDLNYGIGKRTEPGSIFKLVTLLSLLEDKYITIQSKVDCEKGEKYFHGLRIRDSHGGTGVVTVKEAFEMSSNVAFAKLAYQYYSQQPSKFIDHIHNLHLDTLTGVDITASSGFPIVKKAGSKTWSATTIPYMAHGYEVLVTPLHMLMLYNAIANNGRMMRPYLVSAIKDYGVIIKKINPHVIKEKICSDETLVQLRECLKAVVDSVHGTGHRVLFDSSYSISGKTGTAVTALNNKGYNKSNKIYQASFIGYFPSEAPKYSIAVVIQNSNESVLIYGADVSGNVFKEISDKLYSRYISSASIRSPDTIDSTHYQYEGAKNDLTTIFNFLNIPLTDSSSSGNWRTVLLQSNAAGMKSPLPASGSVTPNVTGMGLKDALHLLENKQFKIAVTGRGRVINQSILAGTAFTKGQKITLMLN